MNNTEGLYEGGKALFGHPAEDPFVWYAGSRFHMLLHVFTLGMVNDSILGGYASAPSAFGPWSFQETTVEYGDEMQLSDGSRLEMERWERPHLFLDARGEPRDLYNGVSPKGGGTMANETGHCFTAVQGYKTDDGTLVN